MVLLGMTIWIVLQDMLLILRRNLRSVISAIISNTKGHPSDGLFD